MPYGYHVQGNCIFPAIGSGVVIRSVAETFRPEPMVTHHRNPLRDPVLSRAATTRCSPSS